MITDTRSYQRDWARSTRAKRISLGLCISCAKPVITGKRKCQECLDKQSARKRKRSAEWRSRVKERICPTCGKPCDDGNKMCSRCRNSRNRSIKRFRKKVVDKYGGKCSCCGESEYSVLQIHHVGGGGGRHRRSIGLEGGGYMFCLWLKKNNYPSGYEILCANCHTSRHRNGGVCFHKIRVSS